MALDANIRGSTSGLGAEVNASNQLKVITETDVVTNPNNVGAVRFFSENDPGAVVGTPTLKSPETSADYRLRVGSDTLAFDHTFTETTLDTTKWRIPITPTGTPPMAMSLSGGFLTLNSGGTTPTATAHITLQSQRYFRIRNTSPLYVEITGNLTAVPITNQVFDIGLFIPTGTATPADGVWYSVTSAGVIGVISYNGSVTQTGVLVAPGNLPISQNGTYVLAINSNSVEYWIDDVLHAVLEVPAGQATPFLTDSLPVGMQVRNSGTVAATGQAAIRIGDVGVTVGDITTNRTWAAQMGGMGHHASQYQSGATNMGTSASLPNATAATVTTGAALSQTVPIKTSVVAAPVHAAGGFGGEASLTATIPGLEGAVFAFQNPVGSVTQPPRNLTISGILITASNQGAIVATTGTTVQWALAYGANNATAVPSLAVPETGSLVAATVKQWRRVPLGQTSFAVGAALGTQAPNLYVPFVAPVTISPGEWLAITAKFVFGTATASQIIWCTAMIDGHFD
jgi:hypothetical protein